VFVAGGDVGTGTIVGSAVFNILCIVGVCALAASAQQVRPTRINSIKFCDTDETIKLVAVVS
jgi:Ca2+/Na+ antiporter